MDESRLTKLKEKLATIDEAVSREELTKAIEALLVFSKKLGDKTERELTMIAEAVTKAIERIKSTSDKSLASLEKELTDKAESLMNDIRFEKEAFLAEARKKVDDLKNGEDGLDGADADEEAIYLRLLEKIPPPLPPVDLTEKIEDTREELIEKIEDLEKRIRNTRTAPFIGPSRGVYLYVNGVKKGLINSLDIVGSGVATSVVNGLLTITITGGSGGSSIETPVGTVNGSNLSFTVSNTPLYIIVDGVSKFPTIHYTYLAGTITLLADNAPVQFIRSVY